MIGFEKLWIWDERMKTSLSWYLDVAVNRMPAKYLICRRIPVSISLETSTEEDLWGELDRLTPEFLRLWGEIRKRRVELKDFPVAIPSLLDLCVSLTRKMLAHCNFCRWNCKVDRSQGTKHGTCQLESASRVSSYFHHQGEELIYRGRAGSGTIFFTSCNMRCAFCQNGDISTDKENGIEISPRELALMAWQLRMEGTHNINWVGGEVTIHLHTIVEAIALLPELKPQKRDLRHAQLAKADRYFAYDLYPEHAFYSDMSESPACEGGELNAPMLWNSNFFMSPEAMKILRLLIDVWLPDFKFGPGKCAVALSRTPWYWETVTENLLSVYRWGENLTIRHLVMPNHVECCTKACLTWIKENMPEVPVNVMDQYHPDNFCSPGNSQYSEKYEPISRKPTSREIIESFDLAKSLGLNFETLSYEKNMTGLRGTPAAL